MKFAHFTNIELPLHRVSTRPVVAGPRIPHMHRTATPPRDLGKSGEPLIQLDLAVRAPRDESASVAACSK